MMIRYENLRQNLVARRKQLGLTQRQLADRMGVRQPMLSQLESGDRPNPTLDTLGLWCRALQGRLDVGVVFDGDEAPAEVCWLRSSSPIPTCSCTGETCKVEQDRLTAAGR